jgi:nucleoside-diphosphate-sugar epimerase
MGIALAATKDQAVNQTYNITRCDRNLHTLLGAANQIIDIVGSGKVSVEDRDINFPSRGRLWISKAQTDLGYDPKVNLTEGLIRYIQWFKESPYWQTKL